MAIPPTDIWILFTNYDIITYFLNLASCLEHFISIKHRILATFKINTNKSIMTACMPLIIHLFSSRGQWPCELWPSLGVPLKLSYLNLLLWNYSIKFGCDGPWVVPFQNCARHPRPFFNMAAVNKNLNLIKDNI